jgi:hypothetical protein
MAKRLSGSTNTGKKIMQNQYLFNYTYTGSEQLGNNMLYKFDWSFDNYQSGYISIIVMNNGQIEQSSLIGSDSFSRPLGVYNDQSLYDIFRMMLDSQAIPHK